MSRSISEETITSVRNVSVYDLAQQMGFYVKNAGSRNWVTNCPNINHADQKGKTYISKYKGNFVCYGNGGCGCKGGDAISFYSWSQYGEWDQKHFIDCVIGIAGIMGIPVVYNNWTQKPNKMTHAKPAPVRLPEFNEPESQTDDVCDRTYRRLLSLCTLNENDVTELKIKRKYTDSEIETIGFKSIPRGYSEIKGIIQTLLSEGYDLERVPGFTLRVRKDGNPDNNEDWYWTMNGSGRYFIPVRNSLGQIIRLRMFTGRKELKYCWFSSCPNIFVENDPKKMLKGGASSLAPLSIVPPSVIISEWNDDISSYIDAKTVIVTEGDHKSHISANIVKMLIIGMPGAGHYSNVMSLLKQWGTEKLIIAIDMDGLLDETKEDGKNKYVFNHLVEFSRLALAEEDLEVSLWCWDPKHGKGLDDCLQEGKSPIEINLRTQERKEVYIQAV